MTIYTGLKQPTLKSFAIWLSGHIVFKVFAMSSHELSEYPLRTDFSAHIISGVHFVTIFEFSAYWADERLKTEGNIVDYIAFHFISI